MSTYIQNYNRLGICWLTVEVQRDHRGEVHQAGRSNFSATYWFWAVETRTTSRILSRHNFTTIAPNRRFTWVWANQVHIFFMQTLLFCENVLCCSGGQRRGCDMSKLAALGPGEETMPTELMLRPIDTHRCGVETQPSHLFKVGLHGVQRC